MKEVERIPKNGIAPASMGGYRFVQVGDAADAVRTALGSRGVTMLPTQIEVISEVEHPTQRGGTMTTMSIRTTWTLTDGESGESITIQSLGTGADSGDKFAPKAQSNALKYGLLVGFLLSTGDDPEATETQERGSRERPRPPDRPQPRPAERPARPPRPDGGPPPAVPEAEYVGDREMTGTLDLGRSPQTDGQIRSNDDDLYLGFRLTTDSGNVQCLVEGQLAFELAERQPDLRPLVGQEITVAGGLFMIPWTKDGEAMPPYRRLAVTRVVTDNWSLPET